MTEQDLSPQQRGAATRTEKNGGVHPGGRPTIYKPEYCELVIEMGRQGKSKAQMASNLEVAKQTIDEWAKRNSEFLDALTLALTHSQNWWEGEAQDGLKNRDFNANLWAKSVASRFRDDYTPRQELSGPDGGPVDVQDTEVARRIAFMLGRAVGGQGTEKVE